jgi:nitroreductase
MDDVIGAGGDEVFEVLGSARSMRWFRSDPVDDALLDKVLWAGTRASSPNNTQPWRFVVVKDPELRAGIGALFAERLAAPSSSTPAVSPEDATTRRTYEGAVNLMRTLGEVPVLIFVCGFNRYPEAAPNELLMYSALYAAAQNMLVAARALGLGAAFTTLHRSCEAQIRELLGIPDDAHMGLTMPLGWPARPFGPLTRRPLSEVVSVDRF